MTLDATTLAAHLPDLAPNRLEAHVQRLEQAYLDRFDARVAAEHVASLARLSAGHPVEVIVQRGASQREDRQTAVCTVLAFDHPFEFSLITGVLAASGFRIDSGDVFTLRRPPAEAGSPGRRERRPGRSLGMRPSSGYRRRPARAQRDPFRQRVVIDCFAGWIDEGQSFDAWADDVQAAMNEVIGLLDRDDANSVVKAKRRVNEMVTQKLSDLHFESENEFDSVQIVIDQGDAGRTRLHIAGQDTFAFLYSLSTALSLHGLSIERVRIGGRNDQVEDDIHVVDSDGSAITDATELKRIRLSVQLTKQFTYCLQTSPDPFKALERFERLTEDITAQSVSKAQRWMHLLSNRRAQAELARLFGMSDYLWEHFIRGQHDVLLEIFEPHLAGRAFCEPPETLPLRIEQCLAPAGDLEAAQQRLNAFKDNEVLRIDLDHILSPAVDFRELSRRLTLLAENLISTSARLVYDDLVAQFGRPLDEGGQEAAYAVFGLGKLGGLAMGFASDVELLFVYRGDGQTAGGQREGISNTEFFEQFVRQTTHFIKTKREGIFEVDLRLRPYGREGPLATSRHHFAEYYRSDGPAHVFERLALVRMRWVGGDAALGFEVEGFRDEYVYESGDFDLDALWEVWERQHAQKAQPGRINAKYSRGALTDLEGTVQLLQVLHACRAPQLRSPRISVAMESLRRAGVLTPREYADLSGAYYFLRRLINALRILRGSAQDLFLPPAADDELVHLARRMGYRRHAGVDAGGQLVAEFEQRTAEVRRFVVGHFERECPGIRKPDDAGP